MKIMNLKINNRLDRLKDKLYEKDVESVLISQPENIYYFSGFYGTAGYLLITKEHNILITDFRYEEQSKKQASGYEIFISTGEIKDWFPGLINGLSIKSIGFEGNHLSYSIYNQLIDILAKIKAQINLVSLDRLLSFQRAVKEQCEIEFITNAVLLADEAVDYFIRIAEPGMTELGIAWEIEKYLRENGSQPLPFDVIVSSGPNSSQPHAKPTNRRIKQGEPVLIDLGTKVECYVSDLSRTICLGEPDDMFKRVYDIVLRAQQTAIEGITSSMSGKHADSLARDVIKDSGYGKQFGHSLGHGLGLSVHEEPYLRQSYNSNLDNNMVITIEPGIYISGWGGIRLEDTVILENGKIRVLSQAEKYDPGRF
jgi:Xaa-Pro aminopeptidase